MEGFGRNFKFWAWYYSKTDALTMALIVGVSAMVALFDGGNFLEVFSQMLPMYLGMMVVLEVIVFGFTSVTVFFPFAVGFGAKRDSCIYAKTVFEHVVFLVNMGIAILAFVWSNPAIKDYLVLAIPLLVALMGLLLSAGNLVAMFSSKFGRTAGMIIYIIFVGVMVFACVLLISTGNIEPLINTFLYNSFAASVAIAAVCLLADLGTAYLLLLSVKNKDLVFSV